MKIAFISNNADTKNAGIGRYTSNLMRELLSIDKKNEYVFIHTNKKKYNKHTEYLLPFFDSIPKKLIVGSIFLPYITLKEKVELIHDPGQIFPFFPRMSKVKKILTVHDLSAYLYPNLSSFFGGVYSRLLLPIACHKADKIITISNSTKKDLIKHLHISSSKIKIIYLGVEDKYKRIKNQKVKETIRKYDINKKYILYVGTVEPRKNIPILLKAFSEIKKELDYQLVIVGRMGWNYKKVFDTLNYLNLDKEVVFTGGIPDEDLPYIYNGASLFVYPSYYEGFGLPPLEAMACGCPVIVSNTSSLPEIVGKAGITVNPRDYLAISSEMKKVLKDNKLRNSMIKRGLIQAKKFSWKKCAKKTLELYNEVGG